jgi:hypothetical protein
MQTHQSFSEGGFAGAALANKADDFLRVDIETYSVHSVYDAICTDPKMLGDALCLNEGFQPLSPR